MHKFHIELPTVLWERFKNRAILEHGSPRQAALFLFRAFVNRPDPQKPGEPHAADDDHQPPE